MRTRQCVGHVFKNEEENPNDKEVKCIVACKECYSIHKFLVSTSDDLMRNRCNTVASRKSKKAEEVNVSVDTKQKDIELLATQ